MKHLKYLLIINKGKITFKEGNEVVINEIKRQTSIKRYIKKSRFATIKGAYHCVVDFYVYKNV